MKNGVSICIPVYNGASTLAHTLDSAFAQLPAATEVLLVDNASTDATLAVASRYCDRGLKIFRNDRNLGFNGNFNRALQLAGGAYVVILSADDLLYPDFTGRLKTMLDFHPDAAFAFSGVNLVDPDGNRLGEQRGDYAGDCIPGRVFLEASLLRSHAPILSCCMFNREMAIAAGGFDERFTNSDFMLQILLASRYDICFTRDILGAYRVMPHCTGEIELYGRPDLLTRKLRMLDGLFAKLGIGDFAKLQRPAENRWLRFAENSLPVAAYRYGRRHVAGMLCDILYNRPLQIFSPRLLCAAVLALLPPRQATKWLTIFAARLLGKDGAALRRNFHDYDQAAGRPVVTGRGKELT